MNKITTNTKYIASGDVLFCFLSAEKYLNEEIFQKASKIYCETGFLERIRNNSVVKNYSQYKNKIFECHNLKEELVKQLKDKYSLPRQLIAITGTKGKTSTSWFVMQILGFCGQKCGYIGTLGAYFYDGNKIEKINKDDILTTPAIDDLYYYLNEFKQKNIDTAVFEVSSHALDQARIESLNIDCGVFTNLSQDHLDYHKTMENYFLAKSLLFSKYQKNGASCILNADDDMYDPLFKICSKNNLNITSIGKNNISDAKILSITNSKDIQNVKFVYKNKEYQFQTNILGYFQISNILEAIFACYNISKINLEQLVDCINRLKPPLGRMQRVDNTNVFVDFSHTPKSLEEGIKLLKQNYHKVIVVFGCGGNRDKQKRPIMCEIALKIGDFVIITSDNPRFEKPLDIIKDIICFQDHDVTNPLYQDAFVINEIKKIKEKYLNNYCDYILIEDRKKAIKYAIDKYAYKEDVAILIAGKGHENYQIINDTKLHFNDVEEVLRVLK